MRKNTVISLTATLLAANISFAVPVFADDLQTYNLDTMVVTITYNKLRKFNSKR